MRWELTNFCEIDEQAIKSYCLIHNEDASKNLGNLEFVKEEDVKDCDLVTFGFPCTQISSAGTQKGFYNEDGSKTASGMYFEGMRLIKAKRPKFVIIENVKNLTSKKFYCEFQQVMDDLTYLGYAAYWQLLNAADYGVPQHRDRVFIVAIRNDVDKGYMFPEKVELTKTLWDMLEPEEDVPENYYVKSARLQEIFDRAVLYKESDAEYDEYVGYAEGVSIADGEKLCRVDNAVVNAIIKAEGKIPRNIAMWNLEKRSNYNVANTLTTNCGTLTARASMGLAVVDGGKIRLRRMTPREAYRLMGFSDESYNIVKAAKMPDSFLYKQAGNSIVTTIPECLIEELYAVYPEEFENLRVLSLCSGIGAFEVGLNAFYKKHELVNA